MSPPLTPRQADVLVFFRKRESVGAPSPTYQEVAEHFGWGSRNAAKRHVLELIRKGYLKTRVPGARRAVSSVNTTKLVERLDSDSITELVVPTYLLPQQGVLFAFLQPDDALVEHGIYNNDLIFVGPPEVTVRVRHEVIARNGRPVALAPGHRRTGKLVGLVVAATRYYGSVDDLR